MQTPDQKLCDRIRADFPSALLYLNHLILQGEPFDIALASASCVFDVPSDTLDASYVGQFKCRG